MQSVNFRIDSRSDLIQQYSMEYNKVSSGNLAEGEQAKNLFTSQKESYNSFKEIGSFRALQNDYLIFDEAESLLTNLGKVLERFRLAHRQVAEMTISGSQISGEEFDHLIRVLNQETEGRVNKIDLSLNDTSLKEQKERFSLIKDLFSKVADLKGLLQNAKESDTEKMSTNVYSVEKGINLFKSKDSLLNRIDRITRKIGAGREELKEAKDQIEKKLTIENRPPDMSEIKEERPVIKSSSHKIKADEVLRLLS